MQPFFRCVAAGLARKENLEAVTRALFGRTGTLTDEDDDEFAKELEDLGVSPEEIEAAREEAARFDDDDEGEEVTCWAENVIALRVFVQCRWDKTVLSGMGGATVIYDGINAREVESACNLLGVPPEDRTDVANCVRIMEQAALPLKNKRPT